MTFSNRKLKYAHVKKTATKTFRKLPLTRKRKRFVSVFPSAR